jgi:MYXO-CTERM domain-containing protein
MGRVRGWMRVDEDHDRVMIAELPIGRVATVYTAIGDSPIALAGLYLLGLVGLALRRRRRA